jgi:hypothetical protein
MMRAPTEEVHISAFENSDAFDVDTLNATLPRCLSNGQIARATRSSEQTVHRWQDHGCQGADGRTHKLRYVRIGRRRFTHPIDLDAFLGALNGRP